MIAGIDVGQRKIVIAYPLNNEIPKFEKVWIKDSKSTSVYLSNKLKNERN
jgi:hypothetical protein